MFFTTSKTVFVPLLSDPLPDGNTITRPVADELFSYFRTSPVFQWLGSHNDCEDRANAICLLLDSWGVPNFKAWVFSGSFLKKKGVSGSLRHTWNYHVAPLLPVQEGAETAYYILDPATLNGLETPAVWAEQVTEHAFSYYLVKHSHYYIFHHKKIERTNWHKRDRQNFKWTMQGLAGINGVSPAGKAYLTFNKRKIRRTEALFRTLEKNRPSFLTR